MIPGIIENNRYFDVFIEYAKASPEDILVRITAINREPEAAELDLLPTLWFRNTWSWAANSPRPQLQHDEPPASSSAYPYTVVKARQDYYSHAWLYCDGQPTLLFTENETNVERLYGVANASPYVKDSINDYIVHGKQEAINPAQVDKVSGHYHITLAAGGSRTIQLRSAIKRRTRYCHSARHLRKCSTKISRRQANFTPP